MIFGYSSNICFCSRVACQSDLQHIPESILGFCNARWSETCRGPGVYTVAPHGFQSIKATIKVLPFSYCLSPATDLPFCEGLFNRNWCHFWQYLVGRTCDGGGLCHIE